MNKILALPMELYHNRKLILSLAKNDFKTKYAGSYLGIVWAFIQPVVTIENKDGILYGCTKLELNELLSQEELQEFTEYITGQYSDGWGEGFEQRDIKVDGGTLNVHFWHPDMEQPKMYEKKTEQIPTKPEKQRPKLQFLGHDGNIFSIMGNASTLLKKNKQTAEAKEMCKRVLESGDYYKALLIISEYVETELSPPPKENKKTKKKNQPER